MQAAAVVTREVLADLLEFAFRAKYGIEVDLHADGALEQSADGVAFIIWFDMTQAARMASALEEPKVAAVPEPAPVSRVVSAPVPDAVARLAAAAGATSAFDEAVVVPAVRKAVAANGQDELDRKGRWIIPGDNEPFIESTIRDTDEAKALRAFTLSSLKEGTGADGFDMDVGTFAAAADERKAYLKKLERFRMTLGLPKEPSPGEEDADYVEDPNVSGQEEGGTWG